MLTVFEFLCNVIEGNDRTCDELREHTDICAVVYEVLFSLRLTSVNIGYVGDILEGVEADTDREDNILYGKALVEDGVDVLGTEGPVLEENEPPEVKGNAEKEPELLGVSAVFDELTHYEVEQICQQEKRDVNGLSHAEAVEYGASRKDNEVLILQT